MSTIWELVQKKAEVFFPDRRNTGAPPGEMTVSNFDSPPEEALLRTASSLLNCVDTLSPAIGPAVSSSLHTHSERLPAGASWSDKCASPKRDWRARAVRFRFSSA